MRVSSRYHSYDDYLRHQLNKTADPLLRRAWATHDWWASLLSIARFSSATPAPSSLPSHPHQEQSSRHLRLDLLYLR
jgi:hypothetical protein